MRVKLRPALPTAQMAVALGLARVDRSMLQNGRDMPVSRAFGRGFIYCVRSNKAAP